MLEGIVFLTVWYLIGFVVLTSLWREEEDVTLGDLLVLLFVAAMGPLALFGYVLRWLNSLTTVIFRKKE